MLKIPWVSGVSISFNWLSKSYLKPTFLSFFLPAFLCGSLSLLNYIRQAEIKPTSGKIFVAGKQLSRLRRWQISKFRRKLGVVFQDFRLLPDRTVFENVAFAQRVIETPTREINRQTPTTSIVRYYGKNQATSTFLYHFLFHLTTSKSENRSPVKSKYTVLIKIYYFLR